MFIVDPETKKITLHRGDTGDVTFTASGYTFGADDRALFTIKSSNGTEIVKTAYAMTNNAFTVDFTNAMTDYLTPGAYNYDVRYIVDPQYDEETGEIIIDGTVVSTPGSPYVIEILNTVGQI